MNTNNLLHYTYNPIKKNFLKEHGISYLVEGTHNTTGKKFWTYLKNEELNQALMLWRKYQENKFKNK